MSLTEDGALKDTAQQIMSGLYYLAKNGFPAHHLHTANVLIRKATKGDNKIHILYGLCYPASDTR